MPRSLTGRIVGVVVLPILAAWLAMALALTVALADLHQDASKATLADVGQALIVQFRSAALDRELRVILAQVRESVSGRGIDVQVLRANGSYVDVGEAPATAVPSAPIAIPAGALRGETLSGEIAFTDGQQHLYAATVLREPGTAGPRAIVLSVPDRSRAQAIGDLIRALPLVVIVSAAIGLPLVLVLVRSVAGPLRRLADATADLPDASRHEPLPLEGPTEVRELTARFNAMADELESARIREAALLADLRHDLRTPLTVIAGYATALEDGTATGEDATRAARAITGEAARLERLVDQLGAVERLRRGPEGLRPEPIDAGDLLRASMDRFAPAASAAGIDLAIVSDTIPPLTFMADRGAVDRIMANLISNAIAAAPSPGGHVWLSAVQGANDAQTAPAAHGDAGTQAVVLAVTDDGPGFPPGAAARAFERFYRADPSRSGSGSGLGLAIVREFAIAHGGTVHAENVAPRGARVSVVLPTIPPGR